MTHDTDPNRRHVPGCFLAQHDVAASDAAEAVAGGDRSGDGGAFPLAGDIVGEVGVEGGPVGDVGPCGEVGADVADGDLGGEAEHAEAEDEAEGVKDDDGGAEVVFVGEVAGEEDGEDGVVVGGCGEEDGFVGGEAHAGLEDDGEELFVTGNQ